MKIILGKIVLKNKDGKVVNQPIGRHVKEIKIMLLLIFLFFFMVGPYKILRIQNCEVASGTLQSYRTVSTQARRRGYKETQFELTIDDQVYRIEFKYLSTPREELESKLWDSRLKEVEIEYIPRGIVEETDYFLTELSVDGELLFDNGYLWMKEAIQWTLIGFVFFMVGSFWYLKEIGWIQIVRNRNE